MVGFVLMMGLDSLASSHSHNCVDIYQDDNGKKQVMCAGCSGVVCHVEAHFFIHAAFCCYPD